VERPGQARPGRRQASSLPGTDAEAERGAVGRGTGGRGCCCCCGGCGCGGGGGIPSPAASHLCWHRSCGCRLSLPGCPWQGPPRGGAPAGDGLRSSVAAPADSCQLPLLHLLTSLPGRPAPWVPALKIHGTRPRLLMTSQRTPAARLLKARLVPPAVRWEETTTARSRKVPWRGRRRGFF
jgi:hypothetical protein